MIALLARNKGQQKMIISQSVDNALTCVIAVVYYYCQFFLCNFINDITNVHFYVELFNYIVEIFSGGMTVIKADVSLIFI